jgi:transposase
MTKVPQEERLVTLGVDTHADIHVAVALDQLGGMLGAIEIPTTRAGCAQLLEWASQLGVIDRVGIEGTGSYGAGLFRWLRARGITVVEVDRPDRKLKPAAWQGRSDRRRGGRPLGALRAGHRHPEVGGRQRGDDPGAAGCPPIGHARQDRRDQPAARPGRVRPDELRETFDGLTALAKVRKAAALRPGPSVTTVQAATKLALTKLAHRYLELVAEIAELDTHIARLVKQTAPALLAQPGIGVQCAAQLLVTAGDNPQRLHSEGSFAHLCGVAPVPASSGKRADRHRLNKSGDRDANCALHMIAVNRLSRCERTRAYVTKRSPDGKADLDILRRLKRYIAREVYTILTKDVPATALARAA